MSQRAHPGLSGTVHAAIAALDSVWCMEPTRALAIFEALRGVTWDGYRPGMAPTGRMADKLPNISDANFVPGDGSSPWGQVAVDPNGRSRGYFRDGNVAIIEIVGPMQKQDGWSMDGTSTILTRRAVRQAITDPAVDSILLLVDTPGGQVSGLHDLAMDVRRAAIQKPVYAYCEDICASAGYYVASQANFVYAGPTAMVGSIGTYAVVWDSSAMFADAGVTVHVIKDGDQKGAFTPGTEVTAEQLASYQEVVDFYSAQFRKVVSDTRSDALGGPLQKGVSPAGGMVFMGAEARRVGLVDKITTLDNTLAEMKKRKRS